MGKVPTFKEKGEPVFTRIKPEKVARYVLLAVRDPLGFKRDAAEEIASYFDAYEKVADTGMFKTYTGTYKGVPVTVCSTGSGCPDTELALMDFMLYSNADTFIRVGTSGGFQPYVKPGDIVITTSAVRDEGTSEEYVKPIFPAVAHYEVVLALIQAAEELNVRYHVGITRSNDAIYCGLGRPAVNNYLQKEHEEIIEYWSKAGVLNIEREASIILTLCNLFGYRGGCVCAVVDNYFTGELKLGAGVEEAIKTTLEALTYLYKWDKDKEKANKKFWYPRLTYKQ